MGLPKNFFLPSSARLQGHTPDFVCRLCGDRFYTPNEMGRHVKQCSDQNEQEMRENHSLRTKSPFLFDDQNEGDVEYRDYVRRTGKLT